MCDFQYRKQLVQHRCGSRNENYVIGLCRLNTLVANLSKPPADVGCMLA